MTVRLRVAPSPTGAPHVGTAYVAIFNRAFARQQGGQFVLRIEDTDQQRSERQYETMIFESLRWLGLTWDEGPDVGGPHGPYRQSERTEIYQAHARTLIDRGTAYYCFCSRERLKQVRDAQEAAREAIMYDRHCRTLAPSEVQRKLDGAAPHVVRLAVPPDGEVVFDDLIRGQISIENRILDDQVLLKEDGFPTYHLANVVDDHLMGITHVMRAEEWISSTPKHILLYRAFDWKPPCFGHLPLLRNKDRSKISKRKNPVSLKWYEEEGYLPEAVVNFLALMGFSMPDGREEFGFDDVRDNFSFARLNSAGPVFDLDKLGWLNGNYIRRLSVDALLARMQSIGMDIKDDAYTRSVAPLLIERMKTLKDFLTVGDYFFREDLPLDAAQLVPKKRGAGETADALQRFAGLLQGIEPAAWTKESIESGMRKLTEDIGWATKESFMAVRVAITGKTATPPLVESIVVLGRQRAVQRLRAAADLVRAHTDPSH